MSRTLTAVVGLALVAVACSSDSGGFPDGSFGIVANLDIATGESRVLVSVADEDGTRLGSPELAVDLVAAPFEDPEATQTVPGVFTWMIEDVVGMYRGEFVFDRPGTWQITVQPEEGDPLAPAAVNVLESTITPNVGDPAPVVDTPTLSELPLIELTTDPNPDPGFYQLSLAEALGSGRPTVLVFSTPAYCVTAACGPLLDLVKSAADDFPDTNFIHVEVYTGLTDPDFQPDPAHLAPAAGPDHYDLPTEPWVFVIDPSGTVTGRFEGVMGEDELRAALATG